MVIRKIDISRLTPVAGDGGKQPILDYVLIEKLVVDESYQRP